MRGDKGVRGGDGVRGNYGVRGNREATEKRGDKGAMG